MYIFNVFDDTAITSTVIENLKSKGVKYKLAKQKTRSRNAELKGLFKVSLANLPKVTVSLKSGSVMVKVPIFLHRACSIIEANGNILVEGIFRKGGSSSKQRELKEQLSSGVELSDACHVVDVCNIVKFFFRELPEPLIPHSCHETMLSCLLLSGEAKQREALLLSCLLLPRDNITILSYILEFFNRVAGSSASNKMDARNLAIVVTPSLMHIDERTKLGNNFSVNHHISVIEMLIRSADDVGVVSQELADVAKSRNGRKKRSASITRVFTGIRKIVGKTVSPPREPAPVTATPDSCPKGKRKSQEILHPAITVKRRREMADTTPRMCRMRAYSTGSMPGEVDISNSSKSPLETRSKQKNGTVQQKKGKMQRLKGSKSSSCLLNNKKRQLERKLSSIAWGKRRMSGKTEVRKAVATPDAAAADVVTMSRKEYDDIITRVSWMEKMLQSQPTPETSQVESEQLAQQLEQDLTLTCLPEPDHQSPANPLSNLNTAVQVAFKRTVEHSEQLAPQIRKDVRLRWNSDRVTRSPSERKIGTIRRRSRELVSPASKSCKGPPRSPQSVKTSQRGRQEDWQPAVSALSSAKLSRLRNSPRKRDSITSLRRNNSGMVQAKAKFFDSLNYSVDAESEKSSHSMERHLENVQAELRQARALRQMKENKQPAIKAPLGVSSSNLKTPRSCRTAGRSRQTPLRALLVPDSLTTPLTPVRRSPRILARALPYHMTSTP